MIRALAGYDPARYADVARWPLAEALIAYESLIRHETTVQYHHEQLMFAAGALKKAPRLPPILAPSQGSEG